MPSFWHLHCTACTPGLGLDFVQTGGVAVGLEITISHISSKPLQPPSRGCKAGSSELRALGSSGAAPGNRFAL